MIFAGLFALLYGLVQTAPQMGQPFSPSQKLSISLSPWSLPTYALRSLIRMFAAYAIALLFALVSGRIAAYNPRAERWIIPFLDICQSVPPLGFLAVAVTFFMHVFPGSLLGLECASVVTIFSSQAWNLAFSFYQSLKTLPRDLHEAAINYHLTPWQRFVKLELPFAMTGLVWNSMMSFGSGWFFLAASETITVLRHDYGLPGLGSYMAQAVAAEPVNIGAIVWCIGAIVGTIVLVDQLFWRPVVAWSQRFRSDSAEDDQEPTSVVLDVLRNSNITEWANRRLMAPIGEAMNRALRGRKRVSDMRTPPSLFSRLLRITLWLVVIAWVAPVIGRGAITAISAMSWRMAAHLLYLGFLTSVRIAAVVVLATIIWVPVGVRIGFSQRLARIAQPLVQIAASFPMNVVFPLVTYVFIKLHVSLNWGSILLLLLGTQGYILFNIIAGAMQVPAELKEAAQAFHLRGWNLWKTLILPAIFPAWVTGALTLAGGAWNASIVAEVITWGAHPPAPAAGLGAYITRATGEGDWPGTILSISIMAALVVLLNRWLWQPLYALAEERFTTT
ncbi:MAG TPA: ABC transporter permease subunit [Armatimonadota bacterium]